MTKSNDLPTHLAYIVSGEGKNANWTQVGACWKHKDGEGMNVVLPPGIMISGKLVIRPIKAEHDADAA